MNISRAIPAGRSLLGKNSGCFNGNSRSMSGYNVESTRPTVKVSTGEKIFLGVLLLGSVWSVPSWIIYNTRKYQRQD